MRQREQNSAIIEKEKTETDSKIDIKSIGGRE